MPAAPSPSLTAGDAGGAGAEAVAVLSALAGVRLGDPVAGVGLSPRTERALLAMCGRDALVEAEARVAVAEDPAGVADAAARLRPGGRLVAVAADATEARRVAAAGGLELRHVERLGAGVAWSAVASGPGVPGARAPAGAAPR